MPPTNISSHEGPENGTGGKLGSDAYKSLIDLDGSNTEGYIEGITLDNRQSIIQRWQEMKNSMWVRYISWATEELDRG